MPSIPTFLALFALHSLCFLLWKNLIEMSDFENHVTISAQRMIATCKTKRKKKNSLNPNWNQRFLVFPIQFNMFLLHLDFFYYSSDSVFIIRCDHISLSNAFSRTRARLKWKMYCLFFILQSKISHANISFHGTHTHIYSKTTIKWKWKKNIGTRKKMQQKRNMEMNETQSCSSKCHVRAWNKKKKKKHSMYIKHHSSTIGQVAYTQSSLWWIKKKTYEKATFCYLSSKHRWVSH